MCQQVPLAILVTRGPEPLVPPQAPSSGSDTSVPVSTPPDTAAAAAASEPLLGSTSSSSGEACGSPASAASRRDQPDRSKAAAFVVSTLLCYAALWLLSDLALRAIPEHACGTWVEWAGLARGCDREAARGRELAQERGDPGHWAWETAGFAVMVGAVRQLAWPQGVLPAWRPGASHKCLMKLGVQRPDDPDHVQCVCRCA